MTRRNLRPIALVTLATFLVELLVPTAAAVALTGGPKQPEFSTFESVTTTNMVDPLTGQFTYNLPVVNIPGPNGSGYAVSLSYHSGVSPEQEASWVGYGWTLNPGSITRSKQGLPDDYNGDVVRVWNRSEPNWTVAVGVLALSEFFGQQPFGSLSANAALRFNNYKGFGYVAGITADIKGLASLSASVDDGVASFSMKANPAALLNATKLAHDPNDAAYLGTTQHDIATHYLHSLSNIGYEFGANSLGSDPRATSVTPYKGVSVNVKLDLAGEPSVVPVAPDFGVTGSYTRHEAPNNGLTALKGRGYMYSSHAATADLMDYHLEKESPYTRRENFLSIPFASPDYFSVSGEGIGGGFRLYNKKPGHFRPNSTFSTTAIANLSGQLHLGPQLVGIGGSLGVGLQSLRVGGWEPADGAYKFAGANDDDEPYFFRMNNDRGGSVLFNDDDDPQQADAPFQAGFTSTGALGIDDFTPMIESGDAPPMNGGKRSGRSTHIAYTKMGEWKNPGVHSARGSENYELKDKENLLIQALNHRTLNRLYQAGLPDVTQSDRNKLGEFAITNSSGSRYVYGLPVISYDERQLQFGLRNVTRTIKDSSLAFAPVSMEHSVSIVGEEYTGAYANEFLLTGIETPDYVDRTGDGYTNDDFGGYVNFQYGQSVIFNENVADPSFKWRVPYRGLSYRRGSQTDPKDDMGGVSSGRRTVYYLNSIETKTHVAVFVTNKGGYYHRGNYYRHLVHQDAFTYGLAMGTAFNGSGEERRDGFEAVEDELTASNVQTANTAHNQNGSIAQNHMQRLERIELWSKDEKGTLKEKIQTVHLEYDYSMCHGLPNSWKDPNDTYSSGKLTLKRVFFEYNGTVSARISPYVFGYEYRRRDQSHYAGLASEVVSKYESILDYSTNYTSATEKPKYEHYDIGRWGFRRANGLARAWKLNQWDEQNPNEMTSFDPAAWHLKWIRLPSGGELHVQYEQADYAYVQDRVAMVMVPLKAPEPGDDAMRFRLNLPSALGASQAEGNGLIEAMKDLFVDRKERAYFKVLHALDASPADLGSVKSEYMTGHAPIVDVGRAANGDVYVDFHPEDANAPYSTIMTMAKAFAKTSRAGLLGSMGMVNSENGKSNVQSMLGRIGKPFDDGSGITDVNDTHIDWDDSYIRIPIGKPGKIVRAKKGGGVRVKRMLMYDPGLEANGGHLFGTEYEYKTTDGYTSGVATNEPAEGREESPLVRVLDKRQDQSFLQRLIGGRDKDQFEGPIGESLLPGPAIAYSRVVARSIHSGKTNPGFTIHEFHTVKDFPAQCIYGTESVSDGNATPVDQKHQILALITPYFTYHRSNVWATQGYRFVLNNMHGQPQSVRTYGGDYANPLTWVESASQEYEYFKPGDGIPVIDEYSANPTIKMEKLGKEMETVFEGRSIEDETVDVSFDIDGCIAFIPVPSFIIGYFTGAPNGCSYTESKLKTHVASKVVRYPTVVKKIISRQDGIEQVTENIAFNPLTGDPIATMSTDGYTGLHLQKANGVPPTDPPPHNRVYRSYSFPAAFNYEEMGQKASNDGAEMKSGGDLTISKRFRNGTHYLFFNFKSPATCNTGALSPGDLIRLFPAGQSYDPAFSLGVFHVYSVNGNQAILVPHSHSTPAQNVQSVSLKIIASGKTNQLNTPRASITTYTKLLQVGP